MVRVRIRHLVLAGVAGLVCGRAAAVVREHPDTARPLLAYTAGSTLVGVVLGVGVAAYRRAPVYVYGVSVGANFALCSFTFFGVRHVLKDRLLALSQPAGEGVEPRVRWSLRQVDYLGSGLSGGVAGSLASLLSRHSVALVAGTGVGGVVTGLLGQWLYSTLNSWRTKKALELHYPELAPQRKWTWEAFQESFVRFWNQRSKVRVVESQIVVLENDIAREKQRIAALDRQLALDNQQPTLDRQLVRTTSPPPHTHNTQPITNSNTIT